ncbi:MAG: DUF1684 domain-containing protein [Candidatus Lokiarchaeota archaeon]|nr:DUF1684 domain-containing protein [Candidatus Harpocratesius repetitus]
MLKESEWKEFMEYSRSSKDDFFKSHPQSPLSKSDRANFDGLNYFPLNFAYRLILNLYEYSEKETVEIQDTGNNLRHYLRWGKFEFTLKGKNATLHVYKSQPSDPNLFLPFRDKTNGDTTYGAGRYLDLEEGRDQTEDGRWIVDFNRAYNPFCAYSNNYVCPFVPIENWLDIPIEAGEKKFNDDH